MTHLQEAVVYLQTELNRIPIFSVGKGKWEIHLIASVKHGDVSQLEFIVEEYKNGKIYHASQHSYLEVAVEWYDNLVKDMLE